MVASFLFAFDIGSLALTIGAATGRRGLARGISAAVAVASYLVSTLASMVNRLRPLRPLSVFYHSLGAEPLYNGFSFGHTLVVVLVAGALLLWAAWSFEHRDVAV